jgi:2'-5' RNA ligase
MRAFVGIFLAPSLRAAVQSFCDELTAARPSAKTAIKWVEPENFHLTLKFLGNVPSATLPALTQALHEAASPAFEISFGQADAFPSLLQPQTLWIGVQDGQQHLSALAERIQVQLDAIGFPKDTRQFSAHLTIGRMRQGYTVSGLGKVVKALAPFIHWAAACRFFCPD